MPPGPRPLPSVDEVLSGRKRPSIEDLFRLVHAVNPTDRGLAPEAEWRAYAQKSALQSLLIRLHGEVLTLTPGPDPDVVGLRHVHGDRDACHALVPELDDDARAWVRQQRAGGAPEPPPRPPPVATASPHGSDALSRGRQALEDWDYELAESCFGEAVQDNPLNPQALAALLELLVDHLARDEDALALVDGLPAATWRAPACRRFLLTAAVRAERDTLAHNLLHGLDHPDVADALRTLARRAITRGALSEANSLLLTLRERDPAHSGTLEVEQALEQARSEERRPAELALAELVGTGDWLRVAEAAEELLRRWPNSAEARRCRERAREALALERAMQLVEETAQLAPQEALRRLVEARSLGLSGLDDRIQALKAHLQEEAHHEARSRAVALLSTDRRAGLRAALELAGKDRRTLVDLGLDDLATLLENRRTRRPEQAVEALLALEASEGLSWSQALPLLEPHREWLRSLGPARIRLESMVAEREAELAAQAQTLLEEAMQVGDDDSAAALILRLDRSRLGPEATAQLAELELRIKEARLLRERTERVNSLVDQGRHVEARDLTEALAAEDPRWVDQAVALAHRVNASLQPVLLDPVPLDLGLYTWKARMAPFGPDHSVHPDGKEIFLAECHREWVFVYVVDIDQARLRRAWRYRLPVPGEIVRCTVEADTVWVFGLRTVLALAPDSGRVLAFCLIDAKCREGERVVDQRIMPGTGALWTVLNGKRGHRTLVHNARTGRLLRHLDHVGLALPLSGLHPLRVALYTGQDLSFEDASGHKDTSAGARGPGVADVALSPDGKGFVTIRPNSPEAAPHPVLSPATFRNGPRPDVHLNELDWKPSLTRIVALPEQAMFFVSGASGPGITLLGLHGPALIERWRAWSPAFVVMLSDVDGRHVVLMGLDEHACLLRRLGTDEPDLRLAMELREVDAKDMNPFAGVLTSTPRPPDDGPQHPARAFLQHLVWGDHLLRAGRFEEAVHVLDHPVVWRRFELQSRARLVEAWLPLDPQEPALQWRRMLALTGFVAMRAGQVPYEVKNVHALPGAWTEEELDALAGRVCEALGMEPLKR